MFPLMRWQSIRTIQRSFLQATDVGVFRSLDGGINWLPYNTGMPKIAIFDLQIQNANRLVRAATHGRGIWEIALDPSVVISGQVTGANNSGVTMQTDRFRSGAANDAHRR